MILGPRFLYHRYCASLSNYTINYTVDNKKALNAAVKCLILLEPALGLVLSFVTDMLKGEVRIGKQFKIFNKTIILLVFCRKR